MLTKAQLEMRKSGLGGSDVSAALGLSPWKTQIELWAEKMDKLPQTEPSAAMEWGSRLEAPVLAKFKQEHPHLNVTHGNGTLRHETYPFLLATPDGFIVDEDERMGILEVKTSGSSIWQDVPLHYLLQVQHYMYVMNREFAHFAVLFRGTEYREYGPFVMNREDYEKRILPELRMFWQAVESKTPVFTPAKLSDLGLVMPVDSSLEPLVYDDENQEMVDLLNHIGEMQDIGSLNTDELRKAKLELGILMGDHAKIVDDDGRVLATQVQTKDSIVLDTKRLKVEKPELFDDFGKTKKGYRSLRVY